MQNAITIVWDDPGDRSERDICWKLANPYYFYKTLFPTKVTHLTGIDKG